MKKKKKVNMPRDLVLQGKLMAFCTYDQKALRSIRLCSHNADNGILMGSRSATAISKWLLKASEWVRSGE